MSNQPTKSEAKSTIKAEKKTTTVKYIRLFNHMRCGWGMPPALAYGKMVAHGEAALSKNAPVSHKKTRVAPFTSVRIEKDVFDNFLKNKQTGVIHKGFKKLLDEKCLVVIADKESPDVRDFKDAPAKTEPSEDDLSQDGSMDVLNSKELTIEVTKRKVEIELPPAEK